MIKTNRLQAYAASWNDMEAFIESQTEDILKAAYTEMLQGAMAHPGQWDWYAIWMIELHDGTHVGELCFKGIEEDGATEIGYGVLSEFEGKGYTTEIVIAVSDWALQQPGITRVTAETEEDNIGSIRVLEKAGFTRTGAHGEEGPLFEKR